MSYTISKSYDMRVNNYLGSVRYSYGPILSGTKSGDRVLGFRKKIKNKMDATSPYSITYYKYSSLVPATSRVTYRWSTNPPVTARCTVYSGVNQGFTSLASLPESAALSKAYTKLRQKRSEMNGLLFFGELRETLHMLRHPASALNKCIHTWANDVNRRLRKQPNLRAARNRQILTDMMAGTWLEAQFGWRPFISDLKDISSTVTRVYAQNCVRYDRVSASSRVIVVAKPEVLGVADPGLPDHESGCTHFVWNRTRKSDAGCRYEMFLKSELYGPIDSFKRISEVSGFTFENVVPTAWELVPYSFLVDYFVNIGDCLNAIFTDQSAVRFVVKTTHLKDSVSVIAMQDPKAVASWVASKGNTYISSVSTPGNIEQVRGTLVRTKIDKLPYPELAFTLMNNGMRWGNVTALLSEKLKSFRF